MAAQGSEGVTEVEVVEDIVNSGEYGKKENTIGVGVVRGRLTHQVPG